MDNEHEVKAVARYWHAAKRQQGMTQEELAEALGVTQGAIHKWLTGKQRIPNERLIELGALLDFDPIIVRPSLSRFIRTYPGLPASEQALVLAQMIDSLDDQSRDLLERVLPALSAASKSRHTPEK